MREAWQQRNLELPTAAGAYRHYSENDSIPPPHGEGENGTGTKVFAAIHRACREAARQNVKDQLARASDYPRLLRELLCLYGWRGFLRRAARRLATVLRSRGGAR
jgi:hypothetical protein